MFLFFFFFFFNDTATTEIYTLSLHDALPISWSARPAKPPPSGSPACCRSRRDRKSTRLNSSHGYISYAVFCLKKKKNKNKQNEPAHHSPDEPLPEPNPLRPLTHEASSSAVFD